MKIIDGKALSAKIKDSLAQEVKGIVELGNRTPHLAAILVGEDPASVTYVNNKVKDCHEVGFTSTLIKLDATISQPALLEQVNILNSNPEIDGFIVQLPLPSHIDENQVIEAIDTRKDVDGFHPLNIGKMALGLPSFLPATPYGVIQLLEHYQIETEGKHCVIVGRSNIVGTPLSLLLSRKGKPGNCTVTLCHSKTQNLSEITRIADIIVMALGSPQFLKADMVKNGVVVIDVGTTRIPSDKTKSGFRLSGDVDFEGVSVKCSAITPVPGGVGPMTRLALLQNTLKAYKLSRNL